MGEIKKNSDSHAPARASGESPQTSNSDTEICKTESLASSFDSVAEDYDKYRSNYPKDLIDFVIKQTLLPANKIKAFEIGCGTGKATLQFMEAGCQIKALDPGKELLEIAKTNSSKLLTASSLNEGLQQPDFVLSKMEDYKINPSEEHAFDLIISAQAFHWVEKEKRYKICFDLLKPNGILALFWNGSVPHSTESDTAIIEVYKKWFPNESNWFDNYDQEILKDIQEQLDSKLFQEVQLVRFPRPVEETTFEDYVKGSLTTSHIIVMSEEERKRFFNDVKEVFDRFGGKISSRGQTRLYVGRRK